MKKLNVDYGFSCGRHWITINGIEISQTGGADVYLPDEKVKEIIIALEKE